MLDILCKNLHNYFCQSEDKHIGDFNIVGGNIEPLDFLEPGQYFRIIGSRFNDGIYKFPASNLTDEAFRGAVWAMRVPPAVIALSAEIDNFCEKEGKAGAYTSESFGGYSYTRATDDNGTPATWQTVFSKELAQWRKMQ